MSRADARPRRDPAGQPERTRLSWRRTVLAATVVGLLAVRPAIVHQDTWSTVVAALMLAGWLWLLLVSWRRIRAMAAVRPAVARRSVPLTGLTVAGFAALSVVLVTAG